MNAAVESVLSRLGPKARAQAELELARQGHPDFKHLLPASKPASPAPAAQEAVLDHDPYDVTGGNTEPVKRKETASATEPPKPIVKCHNTEPFLSFSILHPIPSWNAILGMGHWQRAKYKKGVAHAFLSALRAAAAGSSTPTTVPSSLWSIAADTLDSYLTMTQARREFLSRKRKSERKQKSKPSSPSRKGFRK